MARFDGRSLLWVPLIWTVPVVYAMLGLLQPLLRDPVVDLSLEKGEGLPTQRRQPDVEARDAAPLPWKSLRTLDYTVQVGDTLERIASRFNVNRSAIVELNKLETPFIRPGETLTLPNMDGFFHRVAEGESLLGLASRFGVDLSVLVDANDIRRSRLDVGQVLFVPQNVARVSDNFPEFVSPFARKKSSRFSSPLSGDEKPESEVFLLPASYGESILAVAPGMVLTVGEHPRIGHYLWLRHSNGWASLYGHLAAVTVRVGEEVVAQQHLALVGSDYLSGEPSLYYGLYRNARPVVFSDYPPVLAELFRQLDALGVGSSPFVGSEDVGVLG